VAPVAWLFGYHYAGVGKVRDPLDELVVIQPHERAQHGRPERAESRLALVLGPEVVDARDQSGQDVLAEVATVPVLRAEAEAGVEPPRERSGR